MKNNNNIHQFINLVLIGIMIYIGGCSSPNSDAPGTNQAHPPGYIMTHGADVFASLTDCKSCHGADLTGNGEPVPSCFSCHDGGPPFSVHPLPYTDPEEHGLAARANQLLCRGCHGRAENNFDGGAVSDPDLYDNPAGSCSAAACHPSAKAHPTNWQGANDDRDPSYDATHRTISLETVNKSCSLCHKIDGPGAGPLPDAPSCFSAGHTNRDGITTGCHSGGPGFTAPHELPYTDPVDHGAEAKANLGSCQQCHGTPGTIQFEGAIASTSCSAAQCHPNARAHPTNWQGSNDPTTIYASSHRTAGSLDTACAICHNVESDAPGPHPRAPSCFTANFTNSDGSATGCHSSGPGAPHAIPFTSGAVHGPEAKKDLAYCQQCHGSPGTIQFNGGSAPTGCSTNQCHADASAHPTRWQGTNDVTNAYLSSHRNALKQNTTCSICHDFTQGRTAPNSTAPSCFTAGFTNADGSTTGCHSSGPGAPHALPFTSPALHGPDAKADLMYCQECHATPSKGGPGSNPRFNVAVGNLSNGCEDCHTQFTAHPFPSWSGPPTNSHKTAGNLGAACALCHGANLLGPSEGGIGQACDDCHTAGSPLVLSNCTSCHNDPPDGAAPGGNSRPNRDGSHSVHNALPKVDGVCITCHNGFGTNTNGHYDTSSPASVDGLITYDAKSGMFSYNSSSRTCSNVSCHGGQTTPDWLTGSLNVASECKRCHSRGTSQYNSYNSGRHYKHVEDENYSCTLCHDPNKLAGSHFIGLDTTGFEGSADATIKDALSYDTATNRGCSVGGCHGVERWF
jgi:predicted CxxxxCH...CXXCH cytochrome family protein